MPEEVYPTVTFGGRTYYQIETMTLVDLDPQGRTIFLAGTPQGGSGAFGPLVKGDPGVPTVFQEGGDFTPLAHNDPTPASFSVVEVSPATPTSPQVVKIVAALHEGAPGADGTTAIDLSTITGTKGPGRMLVVNAAQDGIAFAIPRIGGMHWPASLADAPAGTTATFQIGAISVAAGTYAFDWRPRINASCLRGGSGPDVRVDLVARLGATNGPVVARAEGLAGSSDRLIVTSGPDAGAANSVNLIPANQAATVYLMSEKQSGADTYWTSRPRYSLEAIAA